MAADVSQTGDTTASNYISDSDLQTILIAYHRWMLHEIRNTDFDLTAASQRPPLDLLSEGFALARLAETLCTRSNGVYPNLKPTVTFRSQKLYNMRLVLEFLEKEAEFRCESPSLGTITADDLVDQDLGASVEFLYLLFKYFILSGIVFNDVVGKEALLGWVTARVSRYPDAPEITSFERSFSSGRLFCYLIRSFSVEAIDIEKLSRVSARQNLNLAINAATRHFNIAPVLDAGMFLLSGDMEKAVSARIVVLFLALSFVNLISIVPAGIAERQVGRLVKFKLCNERMKQEYIKNAKYLVNWMGQMEADLTENSALLAGGSMAGGGLGPVVQGNGSNSNTAGAAGSTSLEEFVQMYRRFVDEEKSAAFVLLREMLKSYQELQSRIFACCKKPFDPPSDLSPSAVRDKQRRVVAAQFAAERRIVGLLGRRLGDELMSQIYADITSAFAAFGDGAFAKLDSISATLSADQMEDPVDTLMEVDASVQQLRVQSLRWRRFLQAFVRRLHDQIVEASPIMLGAVEYKVEDCEEVLGELDALLDAQFTAVASAYTAENENEGKRLRFAFVAEDLTGWMSRTVGKLQAPWQDYKNMRKMLADFHSEKERVDGEIATLKQLDPREAEGVQELFGELQILFTVKETELNVASSVEELKLRYEDLSSSLVLWTQSSSFAFGSMSSGDLLKDMENEREELSVFFDDRQTQVEVLKTLENIWSYLGSSANNAEGAQHFQHTWKGVQSRWNSLSKMAEGRRMENEEKLDDFADLETLAEQFFKTTAAVQSSLLADASDVRQQEFSSLESIDEHVEKTVQAVVAETLCSYVDLMVPFLDMRRKDAAWEEAHRLVHTLCSNTLPMLDSEKKRLAVRLRQAAERQAEQKWSELQVEKISSFLLRSESAVLDKKMSLSDMCDLAHTCGHFDRLSEILPSLVQADVPSGTFRNRIRGIVSHLRNSALQFLDERFLGLVADDFEAGMQYVYELVVALETGLASLDRSESTILLGARRDLTAHLFVTYVHAAECNEVLFSALACSRALQRSVREDIRAPAHLLPRIRAAGQSLEMQLERLGEIAEETAVLDSQRKEFAVHAKSLQSALETLLSGILLCRADSSVVDEARTLEDRRDVSSAHENLLELSRQYEQCVTLHRSIRMKSSLNIHALGCSSCDYLCDMYNYARGVVTERARKVERSEQRLDVLHGLLEWLVDSISTLEAVQPHLSALEELNPYDRLRATTHFQMLLQHVHTAVLSDETCATLDLLLLSGQVVVLAEIPKELRAAANLVRSTLGQMSDRLARQTIPQLQTALKEECDQAVASVQDLAKQVMRLEVWDPTVMFMKEGVVAKCADIVMGEFSSAATLRLHYTLVSDVQHEEQQEIAAAVLSLADSQAVLEATTEKYRMEQQEVLSLLDTFRLDTLSVYQSLVEGDELPALEAALARVREIVLRVQDSVSLPIPRVPVDVGYVVPAAFLSARLSSLLWLLDEVQRRILGRIQLSTRRWTEVGALVAQCERIETTGAPLDPTLSAHQLRRSLAVLKPVRQHHESAVRRGEAALMKVAELQAAQRVQREARRKNAEEARRAESAARMAEVLRMEIVDGHPLLALDNFESIDGPLVEFWIRRLAHRKECLSELIALVGPNNALEEQRHLRQVEESLARASEVAAVRDDLRSTIQRGRMLLDAACGEFLSFLECFDEADFDERRRQGEAMLAEIERMEMQLLMQEYPAEGEAAGQQEPEVSHVLRRELEVHVETAGLMRQEALREERELTEQSDKLAAHAALMREFLAMFSEISVGEVRSLALVAAELAAHAETCAHQALCLELDLMLSARTGSVGPAVCEYDAAVRTASESLHLALMRAWEQADQKAAVALVEHRRSCLDLFVHALHERLALPYCSVLSSSVDGIGPPAHLAAVRWIEQHVQLPGLVAELQDLHCVDSLRQVENMQWMAQQRIRTVESFLASQAAETRAVGSMIEAVASCLLWIRREIRAILMGGLEELDSTRARELTLDEVLVDFPVHEYRDELLRQVSADRSMLRRILSEFVDAAEAANGEGTDAAGTSSTKRSKTEILAKAGALYEYLGEVSKHSKAFTSVPEMVDVVLRHTAVAQNIVGPLIRMQHRESLSAPRTPLRAAPDQSQPMLMNMNDLMDRWQSVTEWIEKACEHCVLDLERGGMVVPAGELITPEEVRQMLMQHRMEHWLQERLQTKRIPLTICAMRSELRLMEGHARRFAVTQVDTRTLAAVVDEGLSSVQQEAVRQIDSAVEAGRSSCPALLLKNGPVLESRMRCRWLLQYCDADDAASRQLLETTLAALAKSAPDFAADEDDEDDGKRRGWMQMMARLDDLLGLSRELSLVDPDLRSRLFDPEGGSARLAKVVDQIRLFDETLPPNEASLLRRVRQAVEDRQREWEGAMQRHEQVTLLRASLEQMAQRLREQMAYFEKLLDSSHQRDIGDLLESPPTSLVAGFASASPTASASPSRRRESVYMSRAPVLGDRRASASPQTAGRMRTGTVFDLKASSEDENIERRTRIEIDRLLRLRQDISRHGDSLAVELLRVCHEILAVAPMSSAEETSALSALTSYEVTWKKASAALQRVRDREGGLLVVDTKLLTRIAEELQEFFEDAELFISQFRSGESLHAARSSLAILENFLFRHDMFARKMQDLSRVAEDEERREELRVLVADLHRRWDGMDAQIRRSLPHTTEISSRIAQLEALLADSHQKQAADLVVQDLSTWTAEECARMLNAQVLCLPPNDLLALNRKSGVIGARGLSLDGSSLPELPIVHAQLRVASCLLERNPGFGTDLIRRLKDVLARCQDHCNACLQVEQESLEISEFLELGHALLEKPPSMEQVSISMIHVTELKKLLDTAPSMQRKIDMVVDRVRSGLSKPVVPKLTVMHDMDPVHDYGDRLQRLTQFVKDGVMERELATKDAQMLVEKYGVPMEMLREYEATFRFLDADRSGFLDQQEVQHMLNALGESTDDATVARVFHLLDTDGSGNVSFEEFVAWARTEFRPLRSQEEVLNMLDSFASTSPLVGPGLSWEDLRKVLASSLSCNELEDLQRMVRTRPNGAVDTVGLVVDLYAP